MVNCIEALDRCIQMLQRMQAGEKMELADRTELSALIEQLQAARQAVESLSDKRWEAKRVLIIATVTQAAEALLRLMLGE